MPLDVTLFAASPPLASLSMREIPSFPPPSCCTGPPRRMTSGPPRKKAIEAGACGTDDTGNGESVRRGDEGKEGGFRLSPSRVMKAGKAASDRARTHE